MQTQRLVTIEAKVLWSVRQSTSNRWLAECDVLGLATEGCSLDEVHSLIPETMGLLFSSLMDDNEFDAFLQKKGWNTKGPVPTAANDIEFDLPFQMIAEGGRDFERVAH